LYRVHLVMSMVYLC